MKSKPGTGLVLNLKSPLSVDHPKNRIVQKKDTEVCVIKAIAGDVLILFGHLRFGHPGGTFVAGGRHAFFNLGFGYGRVDAYAAVKAAIDFTHDERDLMLRNSLDDDGTIGSPALKPVHSPDLWLTNDAATPTTPPPRYDESASP